MSDFVSNGWSLFVAVITVVSVVWCLALLIIASKRKVMAADNSTGHVWDENLREMNNPLPRWWMWLFVITVVFAAVYLAFYPGLGTNAGTLGWTSLNQYEAEQEKADEGTYHWRGRRRNVRGGGTGAGRPRCVAVESLSRYVGSDPGCWWRWI